jgi:hypothetical protein
LYQDVFILMAYFLPIVIRLAESKMRYTAGKEAKNKSKFQGITASMRWAKSAYSSFLAICKTDSPLSGRIQCTDSGGPGLKLPLFFFPSVKLFGKIFLSSPTLMANFFRFCRRWGNSGRLTGSLRYPIPIKNIRLL